MRTLVSLAFIGLIFCGHAAEAQKSVYYGSARNWSIYYVPKIHTCVAVGPKDFRGQNVLIGQIVKTGRWQVALGNPPHFPGNPAFHSVGVYVDGHLITRARAKISHNIASPNLPVAAYNQKVSDSVLRISHGHIIRFEFPNSRIVTLGLKGSAAAMLKVADCTSWYRRARRSYASTGTTQPIPDEEIRFIARLFLTTVGVSNYRIVSKDSRGGLEYKTTDGGYGFIIGLRGRTATVAHMASTITKDLNRECFGTALHAVQKIPTVDGSVSQVMTSHCNNPGKGTKTSISVFHRRVDGRLVVFSYSNNNALPSSFRPPDQNIIETVFNN